MNDGPASFIAGIEGESLSPGERALFARRMPAGFILFARNCKNDEALRLLVAELKSLDRSRPVPVLIDQEGGRVARIKEPLCRHYPPPGKIGALMAHSPDMAAKLAYAQGRHIADDLARFRINVDCIPCLDVAQPETTKAIGDRSFGSDPDEITMLGREMMVGLMDGGVLPVIKHLPGHGRARVDSHLELPRVRADLATLRSTDFKPFIALREAPFAMTAHIVFEAVDRERPATQSPVIIQDIIRGEIGFQGILFSDDLSMEALDGDIVERASRALAAGCDLALHCNGRLAELQALLDHLPGMPVRLQDRLNAAMQLCDGRQAREIPLSPSLLTKLIDG